MKVYGAFGELFSAGKTLIVNYYLDPFMVCVFVGLYAF